MKILVTGGAGFIGSHVVDALLARGDEVIVIDNLSGGKKEFLRQHEMNTWFTFIEADASDYNILEKAADSVEEIWHLAAKPDVKTYTSEDFIRDVHITKNILEVMAKKGVRRIIFSSSSVVYGEAKRIPTPEEAQMMPVSLYGASKVACESLISAYSNCFGIRSWIFRFANVIGERGTHGVIVDFIRKLRDNPNELEILGDGEQTKSYLLVQDCVNAMLKAVDDSDMKFNVFNIGSDDWVSVKRIAKIISEEMRLNPMFRFTGGVRGWVGDVPKMQLAIGKICSLGWKPINNSEEAVRKAAKALLSA